MMWVSGQRVFSDAMLKTFDPLDAFLLLDRAFPALLRFARFLGCANPGLHPQHPERQALRCHGQQAVQHEAGRLLLVPWPSPCVAGRCMRLNSVVSCGARSPRDLLHAVQRLPEMIDRYAVGVDPWVVEETICGLQLCPVQRLRKRTLRALCQPSRECHEPLRQAGVAQRRRAEFFAGPVIGFTRCRQCAPPRSMNVPKVNIGQRSLQAVIRDVGNP